MGFSENLNLRPLISRNFDKAYAGECKSSDLSRLQCSYTSSSSPMSPIEESKGVWIWSECQEVMTAAVERGWSTFIFSPHNTELAHEWSCKLCVSLSVYVKIDTIFYLCQIYELWLRILYK